MIEGTPYTDAEAARAREWVAAHGPRNAWTATYGTAAAMIGRLLDERDRLMAKQTVAAPGDDYIREWHEEFQRWKAVAVAKQGLRDHFAAAALTGLLAGAEHSRETDGADHAGPAYYIADAMLRERERTNHDAAPAAIARTDADRGRTDKADSRPGEGTGNTQDLP